MLFQYLFDCSFQYAIAVQQAHNVWMRHGELFDTYWIWVLLTWVDQIHHGEIFFVFLLNGIFDVGPFYFY